MHTRVTRVVAVLVWAASVAAAQHLDLSQATIVADTSSPVLENAVDMLQDEIERRTGIRPALAMSEPPKDAPAIVVATSRSALPVVADAGAPAQPDGYALLTDRGVTAERTAPTVLLVGHDDRGALFAVGRFIREAELRPRSIAIRDGLRIRTAPKYALRGHQIGYRDTANSYDAWDLDQYEQYFRDLIVFGCNAVELITSLDPEVVDGKVMSRTQWDMNVDLTKLLDRYGLDVWFWMPLEGDVRVPEEARRELEDRERFFAQCADIDHIMVPGGDPGHTHPADLMPWLEKMAEVLHARFPDAGLWVSNQKFKGEESEAFYRYIEEKRPKWLKGVVYGPSSPGTVEENRKRIPTEYMLRRYPDITHTLRCQYPFPDWDNLFAQSLDREACNPRPVTMTAVHNRWAPYSDGFVSYSDGAHDDFNKMLFSVLGWDPETDVDEILEAYGRVFFGPDLAADVARGLRMLEENWIGSPLENEGIESTLAHWNAIGEKGGEALEGNWRYQIHLLRALFDAYIRERGLAEAEYEREALQALARAPEIGSAAAMDAAHEALAQADSDDAGEALRARIEALGPKLLESGGFQLSIYPPYHAKNTERGALLDKLDRPLNDRLWLEAQFAIVRNWDSEDERLARIDRMVNWEDPGPGGFYDDLGNPRKQPHLLGRKPYAEDPGFVQSTHVGFYRSMDTLSREVAPLKYSWLDQAQPPEGDPVILRYEGLDPDVRYRVRVTYWGRYQPVLRLVADGDHEVHGALPTPDPVWPVEYDVAPEATADGVLELEWQLVEGRGVQVPEVWLIRQP